MSYVSSLLDGLKRVFFDSYLVKNLDYFLSFLERILDKSFLFISLNKIQVSLNGCFVSRLIEDTNEIDFFGSSKVLDKFYHSVEEVYKKCLNSFKRGFIGSLLIDLEKELYENPLMVVGLIVLSSISVNSVFYYIFGEWNTFGWTIRGTIGIISLSLIILNNPIKDIS